MATDPVAACPACAGTSPPGARFCMQCGAPLARGCASCGAALPEGARFCPGCGAAPSTPPVTTPTPDRTPRAYTPKHLADKILASRAALEGERKQVTVLFADVRGSMELAEQVDAEQWHAILDRFFAILTDGVHRFEGTVNQYTGDGIMALFGAPLAHEDHAQRACYAALHLREALRAWSEELKRTRGLAFATRIGINSGEVVVGKIGDDLRMDYTAQGHTVGLAQRMESLADPGRVYVADATAKLVSGYFALRDLGDFTLKGVREPVRVHELLGVGALRTRFDRSRARGLSRFAGRAAEMAALDAALEEALAGRGRVVGVVAQAGTGKSRLCFELAERCRARGIRVTSASGVSHGKNVPLLPVLELYRASFGITERDDANATRQKIAGAVVQSDESLVSALPLLFDLLGVPDPERPVAQEPGPERQRALLAALKRLTLARSRREPAVIVFEDLHWIDDATAVFLENLVDAADASRTLLLVNFRPEFSADWTRRSYYQQLALAPLSAEAFAEMLGETLGPDASLRDLAARVHERSGGNPFFAEEIVQELIESGALTGAPGAYRLARPLESLAIPATVQLVLAARIDRLGEREKQALQAAAVIGREFSEQLLRRVAGLEASELAAALRALVQGEFLHETALYPEAEYAFKHPLTQEVAYASQLRDRRARVHAALAQALEEMHAQRLDESAALIAHHWDATGDAERALEWHARAAEWLEAPDPHSARRHWVRVLALAKLAPRSTQLARVSLRAHDQLLFLGVVLGLAIEPAEALYRRGRELAIELAEPGVEARLTGAFAGLLSTAFDPRAVDVAAEAVRLAPQISDPNQYSEAIAYAAPNLWLGGRAAEGLAAVESALAEPRIKLGRPEAFAQLLVSRARALLWLGRLREARSELARATALLESSGDFVLRLFTDWCQVDEMWLRGDASVDDRAERLVARTDDSSVPYLRVQARFTLAETLVAGGNPVRALTVIEEGRALALESRALVVLANGFECLCALALVDVGETTSARRVLESLGSTPNPSAAEAWIALDAVGERARIEEALGNSARYAAGASNPHLLARAHRAGAHLALALGDRERWQRELREALSLCTEMEADGWVARIERELAEGGARASD